MVEDGVEELEDLVYFFVFELFSCGYGVMEEIWWQGKLCDVMFKVLRDLWCGVEGKGIEWGGKRGGGQGKRFQWVEEWGKEVGGRLSMGERC